MRLTEFQAMRGGHGPLEPLLPSAVDPVISPLFRDPLKSVVAIFRINTLTPALTVGSDVNQVYRPRRGMGKQGKGFVCGSPGEWRLCGGSYRLK